MAPISTSRVQSFASSPRTNTSMTLSATSSQKKKRSHGSNMAKVDVEATPFAFWLQADGYENSPWSAINMRTPDITICANADLYLSEFSYDPASQTATPLAELDGLLLDNALAAPGLSHPGMMVATDARVHVSRKNRKNRQDAT